mmetsp:Transcript_23777/g.42080  ORF Transcript_23777/g.42080 Transcript_23777/m.42080 type:complete len:178 (+) Transcript_23777:242-775(+)
MLIGRGNFGAAFYKGCIYAIGGETNGPQLGSTCERLILDENRWESIQLLPQDASNLSAIVVEEESSLYALGGYNDFKDLALIQRLNFDSHTWAVLPLKLPYPAINLACFKIEGSKEYFFIKKTLYCFDPQANTMKTLLTLNAVTPLKSIGGPTYYHEGYLFCSTQFYPDFTEIGHVC